MRTQPFHILDYLLNFPGEDIYELKEGMSGFQLFSLAWDLLINSGEVERRFSPEGRPIYFASTDERAAAFPRSRTTALKREEKRLQDELKEILGTA